MSRNTQLYIWGLLAVLFLTVGTVVPWYLTKQQTDKIEKLARLAVCVSLAEQERLHQPSEKLDLSAGCFGLTADQLLATFQTKGQDVEGLP